MLRMERDPSEFASIVERIEALTKEPGFIYTLALILTRDLFYSPEDAADIDWHEHLNLQELTFLVGLFAKREIDFTMPTEEASAERFERVHLDHVASTDVHAAKHADDYWHSGKSIDRFGVNKKSKNLTRISRIARMNQL